MDYVKKIEALEVKRDALEVLIVPGVSEAERIIIRQQIIAIDSQITGWIARLPPVVGTIGAKHPDRVAIVAPIIVSSEKDCSRVVELPECVIDTGSEYALVLPQATVKALGLGQVGLDFAETAGGKKPIGKYTNVTISMKDSNGNIHDCPLTPWSVLLDADGNDPCPQVLLGLLALESLRLNIDAEGKRLTSYLPPRLFPLAVAPDSVNRGRKLDVVPVVPNT